MSRAKHTIDNYRAALRRSAPPAVSRHPLSHSLVGGVTCTSAASARSGGKRTALNALVSVRVVVAVRIPTTAPYALTT